jgi:hypothetical protein
MWLWFCDFFCLCVFMMVMLNRARARRVLPPDAPNCFCRELLLHFMLCSLTFFMSVVCRLLLSYDVPTRLNSMASWLIVLMRYKREPRLRSGALIPSSAEAPVCRPPYFSSARESVSVACMVNVYFVLTILALNIKRCVCWRGGSAANSRRVTVMTCEIDPMAVKAMALRVSRVFLIIV